MLAIWFGIVTFFMCTQARFEPLSFIPGTFSSAGAWVGANVAMKGSDGGALTSGSEFIVTVSMILGVLSSDTPRTFGTRRWCVPPPYRHRIAWKLPALNLAVAAAVRN